MYKKKLTDTLKQSQSEHLNKQIKLYIYKQYTKNIFW